MESGKLKRKRVSKKTKKAWRKHSDIRDVENFLDDIRLQERTGGVAAEKTDSELFFVDKNAVTCSVVSSKESVDRRRLSKPLRCHAALLPAAGIQPARVSHNTGMCRPASVKRKRRQAKDSAAVSGYLQKSARPRSIAVYDIWSQNDISSSCANADEHFLTTCRKKRVKPPSYYHRKPSELPAIEVPHPGTSYRPDPSDHKDLVQKAAEAERKRLREEQRIKRALDDQFPTADNAPDEMTWLREWTSFSAEATDSDESDITSANVSHNPPVQRENKKTERERKQLKLMKAEERRLAKLKTDKICQSNVLRLKSTKKEVMRQEMELAARAARRQRQKELSDGVETRRLGAIRYKEPSVDLKLNSEQVTCLRQLTPEGSLLRDQFTSLQKRNIIEPRRPAKAMRKYKPKAFEKKAHKSVTE